MYELWSNLAPLIVVSAFPPLQTIVTLLLVRSSIRSAYAWVAGMTTVRLLQGVLFSVLLTTESSAEPKPRQYFFGAVLLILALLFYVKAIRAVIGAEDEDALRKWIAKVGSMSPLAAFGAGAGVMTVSVKFLVFTLAAISAIGDADLPVKLSVVTYILFVVLAQSIPFTILAFASSSSSRSTAILVGFSAWLQRNNRMLTIVFGLIFGTWFLFRAFSHLGLT